MEAQFQSNDQNLDETKLEVEFRQILCIIKNSIIYVNSGYNLSFYRAWLEKLNEPCADKYLRNTYLIRLARQIQGNYLAPPFDRNPPEGHLHMIDDRYFDESDISMNTFQYNNQAFPQRLIQVTPVTCIPNNFPYESTSENPPSNDEIVRDNQEVTHTQGNQPFFQKEFGSESFEENMHTKVKMRKLKSNNINSHETSFPNDNPSEDCPQPIEKPVKGERKGILGNIQEDSSWYDLTDTSLTSIILNPLGSGDAAGRAKLHVFRDETKKFETKIEAGANKPPISINYSEEQSKDQEQKEVKYALKDTHYISNDWKKTIESLQIRLTETLTQNNDLKMTIENLSAQIRSETRKREESECYQEELRQAHIEEIQTIEKIREENTRKLEHSFQMKFDESQKKFTEKIQDLTRNYEIKMKDLKSNNEHIRIEKEKEVYRLSEIIQNQCSRISEEIKALRNQMETFSGKNSNSDEKIFHLQRCVSKMDKLFHKSEKEYMKQIEKLKQEIVKKDKLTQIQLKTQRAELIAKTSAEKQRQFDEFVNHLEVKYIKMLEYHEKEVMENKKEDDDRIEYLKHLLDKYDIPYNLT